jgi:tetratricopeptide (TPR) repeat protein
MEPAPQPVSQPYDFSADGASKVAGGPSERRPSWIPAAILAVVLLPLGFWWLCGEIAAWHAAAAQNRLLDDDLNGGLRWVRSGLRWNPGDDELLAQETDILFRLSKFDDAIAQADIRIAMARQTLSLLDTNANRLQLSQALNLAAYTRAVAGRDLPVAQALIHESIQLLEGIREPDLSLLDTRGYIAYLQGDNDAALADIESAVHLAENYTDEVRENLRQGAPLLVDQRGYLRELKKLDELQAVIIHHRGLVLRKLGRLDEASKDFARAEELGFDPAKGVM